MPTPPDNIGDAATVDATLFRQESTQEFDTATGAPIGGPITNTQFVPNQRIASFRYNFSDMERYDLELGARHYFNPLLADGYKTLTPFVGVAAGASHYNGVSFTVEQNQAFYQRTFEGETEDTTYLITPNPSARVDLYESQWVPNGQISAGVDWQVTPKTSLAFETGVRMHGAREYTNGEKGDTNVSIPFTLRGSYNF